MQKERLGLKQEISIRNEEEKDYQIVEQITREAFYNLYIPGCVEHYLVHIMRQHEDFIPELDFVLELNGEVAGYIMYTKASLTDADGERKNIVTFGPLCIAPDYQRKGFGKKLMQYSFQKAVSLGYDVVVIFGAPADYVSSGFKSCKKYNVSLEGGKFPAAMLVRELTPDCLDGRRWYYHGSAVMEIREEDVFEYDRTLEEMEKKYQSSQEEFYIMSHSFVE